MKSHTPSVSRGAWPQHEPAGWQSVWGPVQSVVKLPDASEAVAAGLSTHSSLPAAAPSAARQRAGRRVCMLHLFRKYTYWKWKSWLAVSRTTAPFVLSGRGHLRSLCLSHNALGSTGFELVLKTLPLHCLTHLDLSAVRRSASDFLPLQHLPFALSQVSYVNYVVFTSVLFPYQVGTKNLSFRRRSVHWPTWALQLTVWQMLMLPPWPGLYMSVCVCVCVCVRLCTCFFDLVIIHAIPFLGALLLVQLWGA